MPIEINFMIGGEAGQGVQSVGFLLAKTFARGGYHVFADQDYESRIRGGHNFYRVRVKDSKVEAISEPVDVLIALNGESIELHDKELSERGVIIFDGEKITGVTSNERLVSVPLEKLAAEKAGNKVMSNTVALGAALGLVDYDFEILAKILPEQFGAGEVGEANVKAARAGYDHILSNYKDKFNYQIQPISATKMMLLNGNEAAALGAMAAGCKFVSAYPMTPSTSIMEYMAAKSEALGIAVVQPEDEIAAMNMIVGAGYAGVRAMTMTSGSGFCLMVEGLGLAGITETPIVVIDGQRPGPAVGLPTRTEQGDLQFVLHAHHGDFPRAVLAPTDAENAFWLTVKAFNIAEKYQLPVIILTDHHLATCYTTVVPFDLSKVKIERGELFSGDKEEDYKRHKVTESGISPRAFPGLSKALVVTDSDEHDETGHLIEDADTRREQMDKRLRKLVGLKTEISPPEFYGSKYAEKTLIGWGSTRGSIREAVDILQREGISVNSIHFSELWPFPAGTVTELLSKEKHTYIVENNATGQLASLIREQTGIEVDDKILKYDGRPITPANIVSEIKRSGD